MAQQFLKGGRIYKLEGQENINYICQICETETPLDESSTQAIEIVLKELLMPAIEQVQKPESDQKCEIHPKEDTNMFCFTCEGKCFCVKCLTKHDNKTHDIQYVGSSLKKLRSKMSDATHTLGASIELIQLQLRRLQDQDQIQSEEIESMTEKIQSQFKMIYQLMNNKENEILLQISNIKDLYQKQTDKMVTEITIKINSLQNLRTDFQNISVSQLQPSGSLLNYYSECKQIMSKVLGQLSFTDVFQSTPQLKYFPDNDMFFKPDEFDQKIAIVKASIEKITLLAPNRSSSYHEQKIVNNHLTQRCQTQMDESTDSFKSHGVSIYSKVHTPLNHQSRLLAKVEEIKNLYTDRVKTQQKPSLQQEVQRSMSELNSKKQSALSALRLQQGLFDSRITKKQR